MTSATELSTIYTEKYKGRTKGRAEREKLKEWRSREGKLSFSCLQIFEVPFKLAKKGGQGKLVGDRPTFQGAESELHYTYFQSCQVTTLFGRLGGWVALTGDQGTVNLA